MEQTSIDRLRALVGAREEVVDDLAPVEYVFGTPKQKIRGFIISGLFIVAVVCFLTWLNRPTQVIQPQVLSSGVPIAGESRSPSPSKIVVDVEGKVRHPGLQILPAGARVADAIAAAGGFQRGVNHTQINLAAHVSDGQLIMIPANGQVASDSAFGGSEGGSGTTSININQATASELDALPGVGPVLAGRIVQWRSAHGSFSSINDLENVPGIGPKVFANLRSYISVS